MSKERLYIFDTTLRDGAQTQGVDFSIEDKEKIASALDNLGVDYIEAGWPGANPKDTDFFNNKPKLSKSQIAAFGMTIRYGNKASEDPGLSKLLAQDLDHYTIVGKSWDFHVTDALGLTLDQNLEVVHDTISYLVGKGKQVIFDAEHFFDGYKANAKYTTEVVKTASKAGARWVALCDTNGGSLPHEISYIISELKMQIDADQLSIHCHDDTGCAVANTIAAIKEGVSHIQGTLNGLGERCGNANLTTLIPTLMLKMNFDIGISNDKLKHLKHISNFLHDSINQPYDTYAPYVGKAAFNHKGGLHAAAMLKDTKSYEHIEPHLVGNCRNILVSDQAGKASMLSKLKDIGIEIDKNHKDLAKLIHQVKENEAKGYSYDLATASFALIAIKLFRKIPNFFKLESFKIIDEKRVNAIGDLITLSEVMLKINIGNKREVIVSEGNGPVNALDKALREALIKYYPEIKETRLSDYKVRIINSKAATGAMIRVILESIDNNGNRWSTIGVSTDLLDASYKAMRDGFLFYLIKNSKHG